VLCGDVTAARDLRQRHERVARFDQRGGDRVTAGDVRHPLAIGGVGGGLGPSPAHDLEVGETPAQSLDEIPGVGGPATAHRAETHDRRLGPLDARDDLRGEETTSTRQRTGLTIAPSISAPSASNSSRTGMASARTGHSTRSSGMRSSTISRVAAMTNRSSSGRRRPSRRSRRANASAGNRTSSNSASFEPVSRRSATMSRQQRTPQQRVRNADHEQSQREQRPLANVDRGFRPEIPGDPAAGFVERVGSSRRGGPGQPAGRGGFAAPAAPAA
jgi:hypothetical protein